jgi:hypothetical protein
MTCLLLALFAVIVLLLLVAVSRANEGFNRDPESQWAYRVIVGALAMAVVIEAFFDDRDVGQARPIPAVETATRV